MIHVNYEPVEFTTFPNGETKMNAESFVTNLSKDKLDIVSFKYENDGDLIRLLFVKEILDMYHSKAVLVILYMPYSRMDRSENGSPFTLKYVTKFINNLSFHEVVVLEPHSDVTPALIDNCEVKYPTDYLLEKAMEEQDFEQKNKGDYLFFPDAGAQKRYHANGWKNLVGYKHRNFETGEIESFQVVGQIPDQPFRAIIVDDLSSYGGTFVASAEQLRKLGATEIYLVVGHAEENILKGKIFETDLIDKVYTTNSIIDIKHAGPRLHIQDVTFG